MDLDDKALTIYKEYPRQVGRGDAIKAIIKVLKVKKVPYDTLIDRTRAFARASEGKDKKYIPHPSTWYNQERYADDESEWRRWQGRQEDNQPLIRSGPKCAECSGLGHRQVWAIDPKAEKLRDEPLGIACRMCRSTNQDYFDDEAHAREVVAGWGWIFCNDQEELTDWWVRLRRQERAKVDEEVPF